MDPDSLAETLPTPRRLHPARAFGLRRGWYVDYLGHRYLGIVSDRYNTVNGVVFGVTEEELAMLDSREAVYFKRTLTDVEFLEPRKALEHREPILAYFTDNPNPNSDLPVSQRYLDVCMSGAARFGDEFLAEFMSTTFSWPNIALQMEDISKHKRHVLTRP
jgi:hypothetical protein